MTPRDRSKSPIPSPLPDDTNVINIIIAQNFNLAAEDVQVQVLQVDYLSQHIVIRTLIVNPVDANQEAGD